MEQKNYKYIIGQGQLYELQKRADALKRMHPAAFSVYELLIDGLGNADVFDSEKEALTAALDKIKNNGSSSVQIWAKYISEEEYFKINSWIVTDDWRVKQAAEYIGLALMYDESRLQIIIDNDISINDVVAY